MTTLRYIDATNKKCKTNFTPKNIVQNTLRTTIFKQMDSVEYSSLAPSMIVRNLFRY
jgi:hypothetical protein